MTNVQFRMPHTESPNDPSYNWTLVIGHWSFRISFHHRPQRAALQPAHLLGALVGGIVVAQKVQDSVNGEERQLILQGHAELLRLAGRSLHGDDDVTQYIGGIWEGVQ